MLKVKATFLDPALAPAERVTRERVGAYIEHLQAANRGYTVLCRVQELYDAIRAMAPSQDWAWLRKIGSAIRSRTRPARSKEGRIQSPGALVDLGLELQGEVALVLGAVLTMALAMLLMGLVFLSNRSGHDQTVHLDSKDQ